MTPRRSSGGYAMLAALLVMTLAATFALVVVGAVHSLQVVEGADASGWRAAALEAEALAAATRSLRWRPSEVAGAVEEDDPGAREAWMVTWAPAPPVTGDVWPRIAVQVVTSSGRANHRDDLVLDVRSEPWAMGVTCSADADIAAPFTVSGSGIYVGGCLRGRENVGFVGVSGFVTPAGAPTDLVRGDDFPAAAVHGGAGIFARGVEIHDGSGQSEFADDTDRHVGVAVQEEWLAGPTAEFLLAAGVEATSPGQALSDGILRLDEVTPAADLAGGRCLLVPSGDEVTIQGSPSPAAGRLLVVVPGDAVLGRPGETLTLSGGLTVAGNLEVRGPLVVNGSLHAGSLSVEAPVIVTTSVLVASVSTRRRRCPHDRGARRMTMQDDRTGRRTLCTQYSICERLAFVRVVGQGAHPDSSKRVPKGIRQGCRHWR